MTIIHNEYKINDAIWQSIKELRGKRYSRSEAVAYLIRMIMDSPSKEWSVSVNQLAKQWCWDNHLVSDFLENLVDGNMLTMQRSSREVMLRLTDDFREVTESFPAYFSILSSETKKATKLEALILLLDHGIPSYRSVANELGWSHHSVIRFVSFLQSQGLSIEGACTNNGEENLGNSP